ncbi:MAG: SDR family oxidoreductase, partial [Clostridia bacterium]|nr:SDR family oxidoreductase [Clostridia bacterium]
MPEKNVLITGASRGIGAACAKKFASHGFSELINYRSADESALCVKNECISLGSPKVITLKADVSKSSDVDVLYSEATAQLGFIDTLVLNAGVASYGLFQDVSEEEFDRVMNTNV